MKILVAVASRHGSTREIADVVAQELRASGHVAVPRDARDVESVDEYDAAVVGSAVYFETF
ncbi:MAG TPA: flavodoxin domain-containing protein [Chloroflexota bacterium]|nr:flavodoxin domain-containing protein [Chloroflexota bacterium]